MYRILRIDNVLPWQVTLKLCRRFAGVAMFSSAGRGDHSPRPVPMYRDRRLVVKWDLDNERPMKGRASRAGLSNSSSSFEKNGCYEDPLGRLQQPQEGVRDQGRTADVHVSLLQGGSAAHGR